MGYIKCITVHNSAGVKSVEDYIEKKEKTTLNTDQFDIKRVLRYDMNGKKTTLDGTQTRLISGYQCSPGMADVDFQRSEVLYNSKHPRQAQYQDKKPVTAIHMIQSFPDVPGLDPRLVHLMGKELVEKLHEQGLGDFQAVISTHMNTDHLHNHILLNAYSTDGSQKFHSNKETLRIVRQLSDEISLSHGIPIIEETRDKTRQRDRGDYYAVKEGRSWKEQMRVDIDYFIQRSKTIDEFMQDMANVGYSFKRGLDDNPVSVSDGDHRIRLEKLGEDYEYGSIVRRINERQGIKVDLEVKTYYKKMPYVPRYTESGRKRTALEMVVLKVINFFKTLKQNVRAEVAAEMKLDEKIEKLTKTANLMDKYDIRNGNDIKAKQKEVGHDVYVLKKQDDTLKKSIDDINAVLHPKEGEEVKMPETLSEIAPMTQPQKQKIYGMIKESPYFIRCPMNQIDAVAAEELIEFLKAHPSDKVPENERPAILRLHGKINTKNAATPEKLAYLLPRLTAIRQKYAPLLAEKNHIYKDIMFVVKNTDEARMYDKAMKDERKNAREQNKAKAPAKDKQKNKQNIER